MKCMIWGHEVMWYNQPRNKAEGWPCSGEGMVPLLRDFDQLRKKWIGWADLIYLTDNTSYLALLEPFRQMDYPIFGGNEDSAKLEVDRAYGQIVMKECGMKIIPAQEFKDYDSAIAFVKKEKRAFVSKPSGHIDEKGKALSYVAQDADDLVYMFKRWKGNPKYVKQARENSFLVQEKKSGCEMAVGGWFGPGGWSRYFCENWEYKKLMDGDLAMNCGEMGTLARYVRTSKLVDKALLPLTPKLEELQYVGYIDVNGAIDEKGDYWPYEITARPGWPLQHNLEALHEGDPAQWMLDLVGGYDTLEAKFNLPCISVVVAIPDFPYSRMTQKEVCDIPIRGVQNMEHVQFCEVKMGEMERLISGKWVTVPCPVTAGDYIAVVCGTGETITGARISAYAAVKKIKLPNDPFWRWDIGKSKLVEQLPKIQKLGYAKGLTY